MAVSARWRFLLLGGSVFGVCAGAGDSNSKPVGAERVLMELSEEDEEVGLGPVLENRMEPFGVLCVAYVDADSENRELMRELASDKEDKELEGLQLSFVNAVQWREGNGNESLILMFRSPFVPLFQMEKLPAMDSEEIAFPAKLGTKWNKKKVKRWLLQNAWPTVNTRNMDKKFGGFPGSKYFDPNANLGGVVLVAANLTGTKEFSVQYRIAKLLRKHAETHTHLRFTIMERTKETRWWRIKFGIGLNLSSDAELMLVDSLKDFSPDDRDEFNHYHGNPNKYLLQNPLDESAVDAFFADYAQKKLPTHWVSEENWTYEAVPERPDDPAFRLSAMDFESVVFDQDPRRARLVAFFNDDAADGCISCAQARKVWNRVAENVQRTKKLREAVLVAAIDQSANEHPEKLIPGKLGEPIVVYYPKGSAAKRKQRRYRAAKMSGKMVEDEIMEAIDDLLFEDEDEDEL